MAKLKEIYTEIMACDLCNHKGWLFFGNALDYDVEACECNPNEMEIN